MQAAEATARALQAAEATARAFIEAPDEATREAILRRAFDERVARFRREMAAAERLAARGY